MPYLENCQVKFCPILNFLVEFKSVNILTAISFIIFCDFSMFYQIFLSPQVKQWKIITYKHGIYLLPHELLSDLRLRILGK